MNPNLKKQIYESCLSAINEKIDYILQLLNELKETGAGETKSTVGDKHETALAMLQIEQENKRNQLKGFMEQKAELLQIDPAVQHMRVAKGSLVKTNFGNLFISVSLGKIYVDNIEVITLSSQSPLGTKMHGAVVGDVIVMNNLEYVIYGVE